MTRIGILNCRHYWGNI